MNDNGLVYAVVLAGPHGIGIEGYHNRQRAIAVARQRAQTSPYVKQDIPRKVPRPTDPEFGAWFGVDADNAFTRIEVRRVRVK